MPESAAWRRWRQARVHDLGDGDGTNLGVGGKLASALRPGKSIARLMASKINAQTRAVALSRPLRVAQHIPCMTKIEYKT